MSITGTNGNDTRTGTTGADSFDMSQGGNDSIAGLGGNDTISMGNAFTAQDTVNGGGGEDVLVLNGSYAPLTFGAATVTNVEKLVLAGGSYAITTHDATVAAGAQLLVDAQGLAPGAALTFDGSAETNGSFLVYASYGNDSITGGKGNDYLIMGHGGADTVRGGEGNDIISMDQSLGTNDVADGGAGSDLVYLRGTYGGAIVLNGSNMVDIETVAVVGANDFTISVQNSLLGAGEVLALDARSLGAGHRVIFFGNAETDGSFDFYDSAGHDMIYGGRQADLFRGDSEGGDDLFSGGEGDDYFYLGDKLTAGDAIHGGAGSMDVLDLDGDYAAGVTFAETGLSGIERITLRGDFAYRLVFADDNLQAGESLMVSGGGKLFVDASAETDARYDLYDTAASDTLIGGGGSDTFRLLEGGSDSVSGGGGSDSFDFDAARTGTATIDGGAGGDLFYFSSCGTGVNFDAVLGTLKIGAGFTATVTSVENAYGSALADMLKGGAGYNYFSAGAGHDTLIGGAGGDNLEGGAGFDRASYAGSSAGVTVSLATGTGTGGDAEGDTLSEIEALIGSAFADVLIGRAGNNLLEGGAGMDMLRGMAGKDTLVGGGGGDRFIFGSVNESSAASSDVILDFNAAQADRIVLSAIDANTTVDGNDAFAFIGGAAFTAAGQLRFANGVLSGDVNGDGVAELVVNLTGVASLGEGSIVL